MKIKKYIINEDLTVDVQGDVFIYNSKLIEIPLQFGIVLGNFDCSENFLTSLRGCPNIVKKTFSCGYNQLTNLEFSPAFIGQDFDCYHNQLISLMGAPKKVINFNCCNNKLTELIGAPEIIELNLNLSSNLLKKLELQHLPKHVDNIILLSNPNLELDYNGEFSLQKLTQLLLKEKLEQNLPIYSFQKIKKI